MKSDLLYLPKHLVHDQNSNPNKNLNSYERVGIGIESFIFHSGFKIEMELSLIK